MKVSFTWCQETRVPLQLLGKTLRLLLVSVTCLIFFSRFFLMWTIFKVFHWVCYSIVSVLCLGIFGCEMCRTLPPCVHVYSVAKSCLTLYDPMACRPPGSSVPGISQARILEWIQYTGSPFPSSGDLPAPGIELKSLASPALAGRFFTAAPLGKPLAPWPGINPEPPELAGEVLTTGLPGKSLLV